MGRRGGIFSEMVVCFVILLILVGVLSTRADLPVHRSIGNDSVCVFGMRTLVDDKGVAYHEIDSTGQPVPCNYSLMN